MGIICALIVQVSILVAMMLCTDWNQEVSDLHVTCQMYA